LVAGDPPESIATTRGGLGEIYRAVLQEDWDEEIRIYDLREGEFPELSADLAGIIITGSAASVLDREAWMLSAEERLRAVFSTETPTLGVCFGHQLLAQALGGEVSPNASGRCMSTIEVERTVDDPLLADLPQTFHVNECHRDSVTQLPEGALAIASSAHDTHEAIRFGEACWGVQFHPEFDAEIMRGYIRARVELLEGEGLDPVGLAERASDTPMSGQVLRNFVRHFVASGAGPD
jgi:GMP synthase (glutamine-hydrolysing)